MSFVTRPRHPVTGARIRLRARSERELATYIHRLNELRTRLRLGTMTQEQVSHELRHLSRGRFTVRDAVERYLARPLGRTTRENVRSLLDNHLIHLAALPFAALDGPRMQAWIDLLIAEGLGQTSVATYWRRMSAVARFACERGWIGQAPWGSYRPRLSAAPVRAPREAARSLDELARLVVAAAALDETRAQRPVRLEAAIAVTAIFGLRAGELAGLRWSDWTIDPPSMLIARQWEDAPLKRGTAPARLGGISELVAILDRQRAQLERLGLYDAEGPIFPHAKRSIARGAPAAYARGGVLASLDLRAVVREAKLANPGAWSPHSLRDTFVTLEAAALGGDLRAVAERSRHASLTSLARYLRALTRDPSPPAFALAKVAADELGPPLLGPTCTPTTK